MKAVAQPADPWISGRTEDPALEGINFVHHDYQSLTNLLENLAEKYPHICKLTSIGRLATRFLTLHGASIGGPQFSMNKFE